MKRRKIAIVVLLLLPFLAASPVRAEGSAVALSAGLFDIAAASESSSPLSPEEDADALEAGVELRWPSRWLGIGPIAGISANDDSAVWAYVGGRRPFGLGQSGWDLALSFAAAYYEQGDSKDLGNELEFRSGLEFLRNLQSGHQIGFQIYHLSNASISDTNPGENSLVFVYTIPLGR